MSDDGFQQLGNGIHRIRIDGDFVIMRSMGVTTLPDLFALREVYLEVRQKYGYLLVLYDSRSGQGVDREARRYMMNPSPDDARPDAAAAFGAKFSSRIVIGMLDRALVAFGKKPSGVAMFEAEADARAYLLQARERLQSH